MGVSPQINVVVSIEGNVNRLITLCLDHIVTVKLHKYKYILRKHTLHKDTLN
jgi:hypothetical protein